MSPATIPAVSQLINEVINMSRRRNEYLINRACELANELAVVYGDIGAIDRASMWLREQAAYGENAGPLVREFCDIMLGDWGHIIADEAAI